MMSCEIMPWNQLNRDMNRIPKK